MLTRHLGPRIGLLLALLPVLLAERVDRLRDHRDRGASAVEWAIIAGAVCILAALVYAAVSAAVSNHDKNIK